MGAPGGSAVITGKDGSKWRIIVQKTIIYNYINKIYNYYLNKNSSLSYYNCEIYP